MADRYQQAHVLHQPPRVAAGFRPPPNANTAGTVNHQQPVISQQTHIHGGAFGPMEIQPPLRTRSTPPTAVDTSFQQPRFTPHKSNGPSMPPAYAAMAAAQVPKQQQHGSGGGGYAPVYGMPDMYAGYGMGHSYMHNTYLQQQQAQRVPIHQPVKRASKALQIVDPSTGKPIVLDAPAEQSPKPDPVPIVAPKATRPNWAQASPINSALVLSCSNNNTASYQKLPMIPINSPPSDSSAPTDVSHQIGKDVSKSLKKIDISKEAAQSQNVTAPIDSSSVKASSKFAAHYRAAADIPDQHARQGARSPNASTSGLAQKEREDDTSPSTDRKPTGDQKSPESSSKALPSSESPSEKSKHPSLLLTSPRQLSSPDVSSTKGSLPSSAKSSVPSSAKSNPLTPRSNPALLDNIPEISLDVKPASISPKPDSGSSQKTSKAASLTQSPSSRSLSPKIRSPRLPHSPQAVRKVADHPSDLPTSWRYTVEQILSFADIVFNGLPEGIALDSPCLKQNPNSSSGRSGFSGGRDSARRISRSSSSTFRNQSHGDSHQDSCNRRLSFREDGDRTNDRPKHDRNHARRASHKGGAKELVRHEEPAIEPLKKSATRWVPRQKVADDQEILKRKVKAVLNKLTLEKFSTLSEQFLDLVKEKVLSVENLKAVVELIFDKALSEPTFVKMYSSLCVSIAESMPEFESRLDETSPNEDRRSQTFKRLLLNQCQQEFERGTSFQVDPTVSEEEREESLRQQKRRFLGNVCFIGELFKDSMLAERIMHTCIYHLLQEALQPLEEDIEALCKLLATIGKKFDRPQAKNHIDSYFHRMQIMTTNPSLSRRAKFMLMDAIDLRKSGWKPRRNEVEAKTIDEFRQDMERDAAEQNARHARPGSRFDSFIGRGNGSKPIPKPHKINDRNSGHNWGPSDLRRNDSFDRRAPVSSRVSVNNPGESNQEQQALRRPSSIRAQTVPATKQPSAEQIKSYSDELDSMIRDYLKNPGGVKDIQHTITSSMADWEASARNKMLVSKSLSISMELKDSDRVNAVELLASLHQERFISSKDLSAGFREIIEFLGDLIYDIPRSPEYLGTIYGQLICKGALSIDCLNESVFDDQIEVGAFAEFVSRVLSAIAVEKGEPETKDMVNNASHFDLIMFLRKPFGAAPGEFVRKRHLSSIVPEILLRDDFLSCLRKNQLDEIDEQVCDILVDRNNHRAASVICRCLLEHCLLSTSYRKASISTAQLEPCSKEKIQEEKSLLKKFSPLFRRISSSMQYSESILEEIHKICYTLGFPEGLSLRLFKAFADMEIVSSASFALWRKQAPDYFGKSKTLESVSGLIDRIVSQQP